MSSESSALPRADRRAGVARRRVLVSTGVAALVLVIGAFLVHAPGGGSAPPLAPRASKASAAGAPLPTPTPTPTGAATQDARWFTPVRNEPVGLAVDGGDVAVVSYATVALLDGASGRPRWIDDVANLSSHHRPAMTADRVVATSNDAMVLLDRATGQQVASVPFHGDGPAGVARAADGRAVAVAGSRVTGDVVAADASTGALRWQAHFPGEVWVAPEGAADVVVVEWEEEHGASVRALDAGSGALRWELHTGAVASAPVVAGDLVVFGDGNTAADASVRAVDARSGAERWSTPAPGNYDDGIQPGADSATAYVLDADGVIAAYDLATGALRWRFASHRMVIETRIVPVGNALVFTSFTNEIVFVDAASGRGLGAGRVHGVPIDANGLGPVLVTAVRLGTPSGVDATPLVSLLPTPSHP